MDIDSSIKIDVQNNVYKPAEDSYLLIKAIDAGRGGKALDMGCGCGIVALHLAKKGCNVMAVDINESAVKNTKINAEKNGLVIKCVKSDLFSNVNEKFDIIAFNPPYLPTKNEDVAWSGGREGVEIIEKFLREAKNYLNKNGRIYLVTSSLGNFSKIIKKFSNEYEFKEIAKESLFFERIYVYMVRKR